LLIRESRAKIAGNLHLKSLLNTPATSHSKLGRKSQVENWEGGDKTNLIKVWENIFREFRVLRKIAVNFINVLRALFCTKVFLSAFSSYILAKKALLYENARLKC
jgi:hypothetical protein